MPGTISHVLSATTPDDTNYEIRPSHWNDSHLATLNAVGSEIIGAFSNANGISFGLSAGAVTASYTQHTNETNFHQVVGGNTIVGDDTTMSGNTVFFEAYNMSLGCVNGNKVEFSAHATSSLQGNFPIVISTTGSTVHFSHAALSLYADGNTTQNSSTTILAASISFGGRGGISAGFSNGTVQISGPPVATDVLDVASAGSTGTTPRYAPEDHRHAGIVRVGVSNVGNTLGNTGASHGQFIFAASGGLTASMSTGAGGTHTIWFSAPTGGGGGFSGGMSNVGNTAGTSGTVGSQIVFVGSDNITLSQSVNGASATLSFLGAGGGGVTLSRWAPDVGITAAGSAQANSSVTLVPFRLECAIAASQLQIPMSVSGATTTNNSSAGMQLSASAVIYTRSSTALSSINSGSVSFSTFYSSNATGSFNGPRKLTISLASASTFTAGEYWMAIHVSTVTTGNTNLGKSISMAVVPTWQAGFGVINYFGSGQTNTRGLRPGLAIHSTGATRASIGFSDITGHSSNSASLANLWFALRNYTIW